MAIRIYDQTVGQLAGIAVSTTGKGTPRQDGTDAYAQIVVSGSGEGVASVAGTGNLVELSGATIAAGSLSFSANGQYAVIDTQGFEAAAFTASGFGVATLAVQWSNLPASGFATGLVSTVGTTNTATTITTSGQYVASSAGRYMKVATTAFTSGGPIVMTPTLSAAAPAVDVGPRDYFTEVGFGNIVNHRRVTALGNNPDIDAGPEDVWSGGGLYPWMTAATSLEIVSSDAADAAAGTGARTVTINGLDAAWAEVAQTVALNGVTAVAIPTSLYRINSALIVSAGSGRVNAGTITIRDSGAGTTRAIIPLGYGITRQSQFTVPAGYTLQIVSSLFSVNRPSSLRDVTVASFIQSSSGVYRLPLEISVDGNPYRHDGVPGIMIPEKTDFGWRCTFVSAVNTDLTAAWLGVMKLNTAN